MEDMLYQSLHHQYKEMNLPTFLLGPDKDFTIFNLKNLNAALPFKSVISRLNFFVFVFIKDGSGSYTVDDRRYDVGPNTVYFTNPGHWRSFCWTHIGEIYLITLTEGFLKENIHEGIFRNFPFLISEILPPQQIEAGDFSYLEEILPLLIKNNFSKAKFRRCITANLFMAILLKLKEIFLPFQTADHSNDRNSFIVKEFKVLLEQHYRELASGKAKKAYQVKDYAEQLSLHPSYFTNVIKSGTGRSVSFWINEKIISEAKSLLQHSTISIKEVAYSLGYCQSSHFSNYFKRHTGHYPKEFKIGINDTTNSETAGI